jgi:RNA polymerase sigma-70 factor (ECF subfamily)
MTIPFAAAPAGSGSDEDQLVRRASRGDRSAFGELYGRYARLIHAILLARVPPADAEDLMHDVFISAFHKLPDLRSPGAFRGWLAAIARNRAAEFHRSVKQEAQTRARGADRRIAGHDEALVVLDAIRKLPEAYRETLILRLVEGMTGPEIAGRTGLTADSVRVNLFRGMKLLRQELGGVDRHE